MPAKFVHRQTSGVRPTLPAGASRGRLAPAFRALPLLLALAWTLPVAAQDAGSRDVSTARPDSAVLGGVTADSIPPDTFADERARTLFTAARERWQAVDASIRSYEAIVKSRAAVWLRTPLKDRTLYRAEAATRVRWASDSTTVTQVLGANEVTPEGRSGDADVDESGGLPFTGDVFDPTSDRLGFGIFPDESGGGGGARAAEDEADAPANGGPEQDESDGDGEVNVGFHHPIAPGSETYYRYQVTDSVRLSLPDGRSLQAVGLEMVPRERSGRLLSGVLWIEPESGAVVRALYRLATDFDLEAELGDDVNLRLVPGMFRPLQFDISMVTVEYSLWDFEYWMPARVRMEGSARAGVVHVPGAVEQSYQILDVIGADDPSQREDAETVAERWLADGLYGQYRLAPREERTAADSARSDSADAPESPEDGRPRQFLLLPEDLAALQTSDLLPPPIWDDAPDFVSEADLEEFARALADLSVPDTNRSHFRWRAGPEIGELTRYNRAEGFSIGARAAWDVATGIGSVGIGGAGWLGIGTWVPDVRLSLTWESAQHRLALTGYHRVEEVDPGARNLGTGNSLMALFFGRDDGDYFRASGARLEWEPVGFRRPWYHVTLSAEEHRALPNQTDFSITGLLGGDDMPFRPALEADRATELAAALELDPWWGTDADGVQGGMDVFLQGAGGDFEWFRASAVGRLATPLVADARLGVELGAGRVWGEAPVQRNWFLGGTRTLRGYPGASAIGASYARGRIELARGTGAARLSIFSDAGWAGEYGDFDWDDALVSAGAGLSFLDGLLRFDVARGLRAPRHWRVELYLDSVL